VLQEEDITLFNGAPAQAWQDVGTLNTHDNKLDFVSCSSCGATLACDAIAIEEESAESGGAQEAVLRVFRVCGLLNDQDRASLNRVGELISMWP
jgi:MinD superfamily P-loop ATPase